MPSVAPPLPVESGQHWQAYSPNLEENMAFPDALRRMNSANQASFRDISHDLMKSSGIGSYKIHNAIGDWHDGAENSLFHVIDDVDPQKAEYVAAWHGLLGNQKAVLTFHAGEQGPDSLYQIILPTTDLDSIRNQLSHFGIQYRTLVPTSSHTTALIYDQGRGLRPNVQQFAEQHNATVREAVGSGKFLGDTSGNPSRTRARQAYRQLIHQYETSIRPSSQSPANAGPGRDAAPSAPVKKFAAQRAEKLPTPGGNQAPAGGAVDQYGMAKKGGQFTTTNRPQPTLPQVPTTPQQPLAQQAEQLPQPQVQKVLKPLTPRIPDAHKQQVRQASEMFADHLSMQAHNLSEQFVEKATREMHEVFGRLPHAAMRHVNANVKKYSFFEGVADLHNHLVENYGPQKGVAGGAYDFVDGHLMLTSPHVNGPGHSVYSHELFHAIDGPTKRFSLSQAWHAAWKKDLASGQMNEYAKSNAIEGFAEFGRLLHQLGSKTILVPKIIQGYPNVSEFMRKTRLWNPR